MRTAATRQLIVAAVALAFAIPAQAQSGHAARSTTWSAKTWLESVQGRSGPEHVEKISRTFKVGPNGWLDLSNVSGDITITEGGGDTITVEATKRVRARDEAEAKRQFQITNLTMAERAGRVEVKVTYTENRARASVDYVVTAPTGTTINTNSVSGDVHVTGFKGEVRAQSVSGDVVVRQSPGVMVAKSVSGDVELEGSVNRDELTAGSVSGNVLIRSAKARTINAETVSGDVEMRDVMCERSSGKSISGNVVYVGTLAKGGRYELTSHSGDVRVTIPGDVGFELNARSFSGNLRSDLPVAFKALDTERRGPNRRLQGTFGDGSAVLTLTSFSGDVTVGKK